MALVLPWGLFFGVMFTFAFRSHEPAWAWIFDFVTYWNQILAAGFSFVRPRAAAFWMLANIACSVAIVVGFAVRSSSASKAEHGTWFDLLQYSFRTAIFFWGIPTMAVLLLLMTAHQKPSKPSEQAASRTPRS